MENDKSSVVAAAARKAWIEPAIDSLDISETAAFPNLGADARGNPAADSQAS